MSKTRKRVARRIHTAPGIHFNELVRVLDLAPGQVQYHLKQLCSSGAVTDEQRYGRTHYYPPECNEWRRGALSLLRRETAGDIAAVLHDRGSARPRTVVDDLDIARSTLEWHVDHLAEQNVVAKERDERNHVTLVLARPTETAQLLNEIDPSSPARMADRFVRLADRLLDERSTDG
jgi:predicted transcriptional regulator